MDRDRRNDRLGVNKIGKNIKKSPLNQPNVANVITPARPQQRPQVYNIRKNDFRSIVQQLKGSQLRDSIPQSTRSEKIRPSALTEINRLHVPPPTMVQPTHNLATSPMLPLPYGSEPVMGHGDNTTSASSVPILPSPRFNSTTNQRYNNSLPSSGFNGRGILPSPTSQYLLQSPTAYRNLHSPRSPYPLLSPGVQYHPPLTPRSFTSSSMDQPGILGPGTFPQPPPASPGTNWDFPITRPR